MKSLLFVLVAASCLCACSAPPSPPEPSGEKVSINPYDFEQFILESQP